jgi:rubrerythrin
MGLNTTAEVIGLAKSLEEESATFYRELAGNYSGAGDTFLTLADDNKKYITQIDRAYYGVITDALEGCFSFNIDPDKYTLDTGVTGDMPYAGALHRAVAMEEQIIGFYVEAARQSESLMADIPRAFKMVARKRGERVARLKTLISE